MKRDKWRNFKLRKVNLDEIDDRILLANLYITQLIILLLAALLLWWQRLSPQKLFTPVIDAGASVIWYGIVCAAAVLVADVVLGKFVPDHVTDDGGINQRIFGNRPTWHIALICLVVSICEELLFRGALQNMMGAYWTSILFALIHVRYLQHWLMTSLVFGISYALGWIYMQTGTLLTPIVAHFLIDFILGCYLRGKNDVRAS